MATFGERDLELMAKRAVDQFLARKASLEEAAAGEARNHQLNPDQIERMTQSANTEAFLRMMDQNKPTGDITQEFDPIDARQVIRIVIDQNGVHVEDPRSQGQDQGSAPMPGMMGPQDSDELPDESMHMNPAEGEPGHVDSPEVEECEEACHDEHDPPGIETEKKPKGPSGFGAAPFAPGKKDKSDTPPKKDKKDGDDKGKKEKKEPAEKEASFTPAQRQAVVLKMRRVADDLRSKRAQADFAFEAGFDRLVARFRGLYKGASFEEFERGVLVEHGDDVGRATLAALRGALRLPEVDLGEKRATLLDRHISDDTPELQAFGDLCRIAKNAERLEAGVQWIKDRCAI